MSQRRKLVYRMPINEKGAKVVSISISCSSDILYFIFALLCSEQEDESRKHFQWQKNPSIKGTVAQEMTMKDLQFTIPYCGTNDEACLVIRHHQGQQVENFWPNLVLELLLR